MLFKLSSAIAAVAALATTAKAASPLDSVTYAGYTNNTRGIPAIPSFQHLYTLYCELFGERFDYGYTPEGLRRAIPITGGNFTGPYFNGTVLNLGADWGVVNNQSGVFHADTRYSLRTSDGANFYTRTSGPNRPNQANLNGSIYATSGLFLNVEIQTGDPRYRWMNDLKIVGTTTTVATNVLRIDTWYMTTSNGTGSVQTPPS